MSELEKIARAIAASLGDDLDDAFSCKGEWNQERGERGGRFRDINEPFRGDYLDAARAALLSIREPNNGVTSAMDAETYADSSSYSRWQSGIDYILNEKPNQ